MNVNGLSVGFFRGQIYSIPNLAMNKDKVHKSYVFAPVIKAVFLLDIFLSTKIKINVDGFKCIGFKNQPGCNDKFFLILLYAQGICYAPFAF